MKILEHNVETGQAAERDATASEIAEIKNYAAESKAKQSKIESDANAKAALLERLGITADEAALLIQ
tara:strand:+ start:137 stop:337 length:201 start_codon:yes stop_codon:yes gene_type:complete